MAEEAKNDAPTETPPVLEENNNASTLSTKLSTDQLICKTPRESPSTSIKSADKDYRGGLSPGCDGARSYLLYLGVAQLFFGLLMVIFGILVIVHDASLAQMGGGLWGGCLAMVTGISGVMAAARDWCPLKSTPQKVAHTAFLALSLVSLAISQLVVALAATGLGRDINSSEYELVSEEGLRQTTTTTQSPPHGKIAITLPMNYLSLLSNIGLLVVAGIECVLAAVSSYKSSRLLCPCFRRNQDLMDELNSRHRHALVSSWLGKHNPPPQLYVVATSPSSTGKGSKLTGGLSVTPLFAMPPPMMQPPIIGYPLIPAPLGSIPSPIIPPPSRREILRDRRHKRYFSRTRPPSRERTPAMSRRSRSKSREKSVTEEDVAKTYTGLDKIIAEEFIDICDSRNASLCSDSSCTSSCQRSCNGGCSNSNSEVASREYLVAKT